MRERRLMSRQAHIVPVMSEKRGRGEGCSVGRHAGAHAHVHCLSCLKDVSNKAVKSSKVKGLSGGNESVIWQVDQRMMYEGE